MSDKTPIEWTESTWSPIRGTVARWTCARVSPGCDHCYAATLNRRFGGPDYAAAGRPLNDPARLDERALLEPLRWKRPRRVFLSSMTDVFGEWVPDEWLDRIWAVMALAPRHTFQVLTKRPTRMRDYLKGEDLYDRVLRAAQPLRARWPELMRIGISDPATRPLPNAWLGTSVELDRYAWRASVLAGTPAAVRFVSAEPLLGPLSSLPMGVCACGDWDTSHPGGTGPCGRCSWSNAPYDVCSRFRPVRPAIDWIIVGGESGGPRERRLVEPCTFVDYEDGYRRRGPCGTACPGCGGLQLQPTWEGFDWVQDLRKRATAAGVAFFFKQWGGARPTSGGRLLDGRTWDEFPAAGRREAVHA